jgi:hypothetical protein
MKNLFYKRVTTVLILVTTIGDENPVTGDNYPFTKFDAPSRPFCNDRAGMKRLPVKNDLIEKLM